MASAETILRMQDEFICIMVLILFEIILSKVSLLQNKCYFPQWQAFTAYRSASLGPVENVLPINVIIQNIILYNIIWC